MGHVPDKSEACSQGGCPAGVSAATGTGTAPICTKATLHAAPNSKTPACQTRSHVAVIELNRFADLMPRGLDDSTMTTPRP